MPNTVCKRVTWRGAVGKTAMVGAKDRGSNQVTAKVVASTAAVSGRALRTAASQ